MLVTWIGLIASVLVVFNIWPRAALLVSFVCFLSFVTTARDFSGYQSDGMLLEAGFIALFFAPPVLRPGLARAHPASRASLFLLRWEAFRIYFESGLAKMLSHDPTWRNFTAMDDYYQNAPLPSWIGWYVGHFPHWFHAGAVFYTLAIELVLCWLIFLPRRFRIAFFLIVLPFQIEHHPHRQLRVSELHRALPRHPVSRRPLHRMDRAAANPRARRPRACPRRGAIRERRSERIRELALAPHSSARALDHRRNLPRVRLLRHARRARLDARAERAAAAAARSKRSSHFASRINTASSP